MRKDRGVRDGIQAGRRRLRSSFTNIVNENCLKLCNIINYGCKRVGYNRTQNYMYTSDFISEGHHEIHVHSFVFTERLVLCSTNIGHWIQ